MEQHDYRQGVMIYDFTGLPLEAEEVRAAFDAAVLYLRTRQSGVMEFLHEEAEGTIVCKGQDRLGDTSGWRFQADFGGERDITYLFPYRCEDAAVPKDAVVFRKMRKVSAAGKARMPPVKGNKTIN